jgi:protein involved in polysaccharide export with SLBB domain
MFGSRSFFLLRFFVILFAVALSARLMVIAQPGGAIVPGIKGGELPFSGSSMSSRQTLLSQLGTASPVERPINPESYLLGPTDQLLLSIPTEMADIPLVVSLDNTISVPPGFGLIDVRGMTLAGFRRKVDSMFRARSSNAKNVGVSLLKPRAIYVTVRGDVLNPGRMILTAADRVSTAIDAANQISLDITPGQQAELLKEKKIRDSRLSEETGGWDVDIPRRVLVRHNDGSSREVDMMRYLAMSEESQNPTLREGDVIIVSRPDPLEATISIAGAVNTPLVIPYQPGDNALLLVRLSSGARNDADLAGAYIVSQTPAGTNTQPVDLADTAALAARTLSPGDYLVVPVQSTRTPARAGIIAVTGEVVSPSTYPITPGETKLSEAIARAGGFTQEAALNGAYILRRPIIDNLYESQKSVDPLANMATSSLYLEDTTRFKYDIEVQQNRVSADFVGLFTNNDQTKDVPLENGDQIVVPRNPGAVYVRGRVSNPGWIAYRSGAEVDDYIAAAGGFTEAADYGRTQIQRYGTGIWEDAAAAVRPGDQIYVPGERDTPSRTSLEQAASIVTITSALGYLILQIIDFYIRQSEKP